MTNQTTLKESSGHCRCIGTVKRENENGKMQVAYQVSDADAKGVLDNGKSTPSLTDAFVQKKHTWRRTRTSFMLITPEQPQSNKSFTSQRGSKSQDLHPTWSSLIGQVLGGLLKDKGNQEASRAL